MITIGMPSLGDAITAILAIILYFATAIPLAILIFGKDFFIKK